MIKLAILGIENSHAHHFSSVLASKDGEKLFDDVELIGVYGDPNEDGFEKGREVIEQVSSATVYSDDYNRFLDEADAIMVTARHGANHFKYAKKYIEKGISVWIDKPFTCDIDEAKDMLALADENNAVICGGSSLEHIEEVKSLGELVKEKRDEIRGGHISSPVNMNNPYGGFWFYTQHLVAMITTIFGRDIKSVKALKDGDTVHAIYKYDSFSVTAFYGAGYSATVYTGDYTAVSKSFDLPSDYYLPELKAFYKALKDGKSDKSAEALIAPVYLLDATIRAYTENREIEINFN